MVKDSIKELEELEVLALSRKAEKQKKWH